MAKKCKGQGSMDWTSDFVRLSKSVKDIIGFTSKDIEPFKNDLIPLPVNGVFAEGGDYLWIRVRKSSSEALLNCMEFQVRWNHDMSKGSIGSVFDVDSVHGLIGMMLVYIDGGFLSYRWIKTTELFSNLGIEESLEDDLNAALVDLVTDYAERYAYIHMDRFGDWYMGAREQSLNKMDEANDIAEFIKSKGEQHGEVAPNHTVWWSLKTSEISDVNLRIRESEDVMYDANPIERKFILDDDGKNHPSVLWLTESYGNSLDTMTRTFEVGFQFTKHIEDLDTTIALPHVYLEDLDWDSIVDLALKVKEIEKVTYPEEVKDAISELGLLKSQVQGEVIDYIANYLPNFNNENPPATVEELVKQYQVPTEAIINAKNIFHKNVHYMVQVASSSLIVSKVNNVVEDDHPAFVFDNKEDLHKMINNNLYSYDKVIFIDETISWEDQLKKL